MVKQVALDWYETENLADGISLIRERHVADWLRCNIWHLRGRDRRLPPTSVGKGFVLR